jgi:hypothetical protein
VVEPNTVLVERNAIGSTVVLVEREHRFEPHGKSIGGLVVDKERGSPEQDLVPGDASVEVTDGHCEVGHGRE